MTLDAWSENTRLMVRRERPTGAPLSPFDTIEGLRRTAFITDTLDQDLAALGLPLRRRGRAE